MSVGGNLGPYLPTTTVQSTIPNANPSTLESAAQQIASASYSSYGTLPNPQAVYEAAQAGATATISQLALMGTPEYATQLTGSPAGGQIASVPYVPTTAQTPAQATGNASVYGSAPTAAQQKTLISQSGNSGWAPLGSVPTANLAWMNSIENSTDPTQIKQWQSMLSANSGGYYGRNTGNHVTGVWNPTTDTAALQGFLINRFMPDALFSSDPTTATNANQFLSALGVDTASMQQQMRDPTMLASVAQQWMMAQGPNAGPSTNLLQQYADKYGYSALPTSYQAIVRPDPLRSVRDGLLNLPVVGLLNNVPLLSGGLHGVVNLLTGNLDFGHLFADPRSVEATTVKAQMKSLDNLSQADIDNMTPLLNQVADDSGFMGFMDSWDHDRNAFILEIGSTLVNGFTKGKWQNPFDPTSASNMWAQAHADNMAGALFGDQFAQNNPVFAGMLNFVINTADDPTSYIGLLGKLGFVTEAKNTATASKILDKTTGPALTMRSLFGTLKDPETRKVWGDLAGAGMKEKVSDGWMKTARAAVKAGTLSTIDVAEGFAIPKVGSEAAAKYQLVKKILAAPDDATARDLMMNGDGDVLGFGHQMTSGRAVYNTHANWASVAKAASSGKLNHMRAMGAFSESLDDALITDPVKTLGNFRTRALVAGMTPAEYGPLVDKLGDAIMGAQGNVEGALEAAKNFEDAILKANEAHFGVTKAMLDKVRGYRYASKMQAAPSDAKNLYAPDPTAESSATAKEVSTVVTGAADRDDAALKQDRVNEINHQLNELNGIAAPDDPHVLQLQQELSTIQQRGAPMLTTQLADLYQFPYTPYEMTVAKSPRLRAWEKTQAAVRADAIQSVWKNWAVGRISSAFRITLGDDTIRPVTMLIGAGHPIAGFRLLGTSILKSVGLIVPYARKASMTQVEEILSKHPEAYRLLQTYAKMVNETMPHAFQAFHPTDVGYADALHHVVTNLLAPDPLVQTWLKGYEEGAKTLDLKDVSDIPKASYYHGTPVPWKGHAPAREAGRSADNLYGPGTYITDDPVIASTYTRKEYDPVNPTGSRTVYGLEPKKNWNIIDLTKPFPADVRNIIGRYARIDESYEDPEDYAKLMDQIKTEPGTEIWKHLFQIIQDVMPEKEADQHLRDLTAELKAKGYDGFKYQGGAATAALRRGAASTDYRAHNAYSIWDPSELRVSSVTNREPAMVGARRALEDLVRNATSGKEGYTAATKMKALPADALKSATTAQRKAMQQQALEFHSQTEQAKIASWLRVQNGNLSEAHLQAVLDRWHSYASGLFRDENVRNWVKGGAPNMKAVAKHVRNTAHLTTSQLPVISSRAMNGYAQQMLGGGLTKFPQLVFNEITKPMVDGARANGFMSVKDLYDKSIRRYYAGTSTAARSDFADLVDRESTSQAVDWMMNNTYQGGRSIVGGTLRNVMPFYGATANLDRFVWRQAMAHPAVGVAAVRAMNASEESQVNQTSPAFTGANGFMAMLGFGGGEGLQFNPLNAFFLTGDGLGSVIPGTGPVFSPLWQGLSSVSPGLTQLLSTIPGISQEIDWSTGAPAPMFPWLSDLLQGAAMSAFGTGNVVTNTLENLPGIGLGSDKVNTLMSEKIQQEDRDKGGSGPQGQVTQADEQGIARQVGYDLVGQGAAQFVIPMSPEVKDTTAANNSLALDTWRSATTDAEKNTIVSQALGIKPAEWQAALDQTQGAPTIAELVARNPNSAGALMAYDDSRVSEDQRDAIQQAAPWVVSTAAGKYQYTSTQTVSDLSQWDLMRNMGDVNVLQPFGDQNSFLSKVTDERQVNNAWLQYDQLKNLEYSMMAANGWSTQSPNYTAWNDAVMQPALVTMENEFPAWATKFGAGGGGTSASSLAEASAPLRTLQTWEAIPQNPDYETQTSTSWRNAIQARDQAASMIYQLNQTGGSATETQMVMTQLQDTLQQLASQDPTFASQIAGYTFGKWQDVVNLEADEQLGNFYAQTTVP